MHYLYLNNCEPYGCEIQPGADDSRSGRSSLATVSSHLDAWAWNGDTWQGFVKCMTDFYAPFDITVTTDNPGGADHFELIAAGLAGQLGEDGAAGVAPGIPCGGLTENTIAFVFANHTSDLDALCWIGAQETGHMFGLDHELLADDPMTYLPPLHKSGFEAAVVPCGETEPRECACGGSVQDSHARLLRTLGAARPVPQFGELGAACTSPMDCRSEQCATDGAQQLCTQPCDPTGSCPDGFSCTADRMCWPETTSPSDSQGCDTGATPSMVPALTLLLILRRRDRRASASVRTAFRR